MTMRMFSMAASALAVLLATGSAHAQDTIKIGVTQPLTGAVAAAGNYVVQGAKVAAEQINAAGGVLGKKIELIIEDNKSNPTEAVATVEKLIVKDKVPVILGAWSSTFTLAVMPKLEEYKVPMVVETSSSGKITTSGNPYVFRIAPTSEMEAKAFAKVVKNYNIKKADFLSVNNDWGRGSADEFSKMMKANGIEVGIIEYMDPKATDLSAQLAKIKSSGGDTLILTTSVEQITLVLKQAKDQQLSHKVISTGGSASPDQLIQQAGEAANGSFHLVFFAPWFPDLLTYPEIGKKFADDWVKMGFNPAGLTEGFRGFDGITTIVAGLKAAGKPDPEAIRAGLWDIKAQGLNGNIVFTKQGPAGKESGQNEPNVYVIKIDGGKVVKS